VNPAEPAGADLPEARPPHLGLFAVFLRFLRFGALAFGGPIAQIAMIRRELVDQERWIDSARFNRLLAVMQALPGPEAHELCVHLGIRARGRIGGVLAGLGFMIPGLVLMLLAAWAYTTLAGQSPLLAAVFAGVQATVLAVILRAVQGIGRHILVSPLLWAVAAAAAAATLVGVSFWIVLPAAGLAWAAARSGRRDRLILTGLVAGALAVLTRSVPAVVVPETTAATATTLALFLAGLKGGLFTFGGAYTAIPFVRADTVERGWLTDAAFLDGVGVANMLPAPLVIFATFAGWMSGGLAGALAITTGMFLPAFAFSLVFYERLEQVVEDRRLQTLLAGVAAAVVGLIAVTVVQLGAAAWTTSPDPRVSAALFLLALLTVELWKSRFTAPVVLAVGAAAGAIWFR
jgi:chromate transporter